MAMASKKERRAARKAYIKAAGKHKPGPGSGRFKAGQKSVAAGLKSSQLRPGETKQEAAAGIMAAQGRKKYGKTKMAAWSAAGKK
jgi:hypothetical protein